MGQRTIIVLMAITTTTTWSIARRFPALGAPLPSLSRLMSVSL